LIIKQLIVPQLIVPQLFVLARGDTQRPDLAPGAGDTDYQAGNTPVDK
jgi:hypothetical protein